MTTSIKIVIGVLVVAVLGFLYITYFSAPPSPSPDVLAEEVPNGEGAAGREVLDLLNSLNTVSFETDFFTKKEFLSLQDFSVSLSPRDVGRPNPFAPAP
ncbi:MAG TPA: hypothetical protein VJJ73_01795 [Candidatus Paceibacterota bacterium]